MIAAALNKDRAPILVLGVGNILRKDDGFADAVLKALEKMDLPEGVELFDAGTSIIDFMDIFNGREKLIVVDAIHGGQEPGTLYRFSPQEVESGALPTHSIHQEGLLETLQIGELVGCKPQEAVVVGVQPADTSLGIGLTPAIEAQVDRAIKLVLKEIESYQG